MWSDMKMKSECADGRNAAGRSANKQAWQSERVGTVADRWMAIGATSIAVVVGTLFLVNTVSVRVATMSALAVVVAIIVGARIARRRTRKTSAARNTTYRWKRGAEGEQQTAEALKALPRDGYVVFHDLRLGKLRANIDHVVVGRTGVFVLDTKNWTKRAAFDQRINDWWYGEPLRTLAIPTLAERDYIVTTLEAPLRHWRTPVFAAWVMAGAEQVVHNIDEVNVIPIRLVASWISSRPTVLTDSQVAKLASELNKRARSAF